MAHVSCNVFIFFFTDDIIIVIIIVAYNIIHVMCVGKNKKYMYLYLIMITSYIVRKWRIFTARIDRGVENRLKRT